MKYLDRVLQQWRISKAGPFIQPGARVLDIGSSEGVLFKQFAGRLASGVGIDPMLPVGRSEGGFSFVRGFFPQDMPEVEPFDIITMLAVLEHFPANQYAPLRQGCARFLKPGGFLVITVPGPAVDKILDILKNLRMIDGMALDEHHGFEVEQTLTLFPPPEFQLRKRGVFQLGMNNLFVFQRAVNGRI